MASKGGSSRNDDDGANNKKVTDQPRKVTVSAAERANWSVRTTTQDAGLLPTLGVTLWLGWNGLLVYLILYLIFFAGPIGRTVVIGLSTLSLLVPRDFPRGLGFAFGNWCMRMAEQYFGLTTIIEDEDALVKIAEADDEAAVFAFEPHDILPYPVFAFNPSLGRIPGNGHGCLMTSAIFRSPFLRQVYTWCQAHPIDRTTFRNRLERGESFAFVPGGVQEVTSQDPDVPDDLVLYLKNRKGFIRLALSTGSPVVPVFAFNMDGSFGYWIPRGAWVTRLARQVGFLPLVFWGRFGLPFGIPRPQNIIVVIGKPIDFPCEGDNVKEETVERYQAIFLDEMEALFERHKHDAGYGHRRLRII